MDKFGLFNLLSALVSPSANDEHIDSAPAPDPQNQTTPCGTDSSSPAAVPSRGFFSPDERLARAADLLERHNSISRRIDKKFGK